ncbi:MAG: alpha/beta hydrolase [Bacteroidetes bacterium]|nr:MAG: alpha/beta hydrolase [Bacteroidota bacterium]
MWVIAHKQCVLFASLIFTLTIACNTSDSTKENELKMDSMNTNTISATAQEVKGPAGHLYVDDGGRGSKLPILFVHSFGGNTQHWQNQLEYYRKNRRAIAFDLRGHGRSAAPENNNYSVEALAKDIATVVDSLNLDRFILVGHSMGGSAAIAYAGKHPEKVAGLVITGTPGKSPASVSKPIISSLESEKYDAVMSQYMDQLLKDAKPETDKLEREGMNHVSKEASISIIKSVFNYNPVPDLHRYPGPELIISRSGDEQPNSLHSEFPTIPYRTVEGTSHWIQLDKPAEFNRLLDEFLRRVEKR